MAQNPYQRVSPGMYRGPNGQVIRSQQMPPARAPQPRISQGARNLPRPTGSLPPQQQMPEAFNEPQPMQNQFGGGRAPMPQGPNYLANDKMAYMPQSQFPQPWETGQMHTMMGRGPQMSPDQFQQMGQMYGQEGPQRKRMMGGMPGGNQGFNPQMSRGFAPQMNQAYRPRHGAMEMSPEVAQMYGGGMAQTGTRGQAPPGMVVPAGQDFAQIQQDPAMRQKMADMQRAHEASNQGKFGPAQGLLTPPPIKV